MKPEEKTEILLYNWLRPYCKEIYFNRKNLLSALTFNIRGEDKKVKCPDFIIKTNSNQYLVIEVKPNRPSRTVKQGHNQLLERYWIPYAIGKTKYLIDNIEIEIDKFLFATDSSMKGYLYEQEDFKDNLDCEEENKKKCVLEFKTIPRYEGIRSYDLIRELWTHLKEFRIKKESLIIKTPGLGILITDKDCTIPKIFVNQKVKTRWAQHYWRL